MALDDQLEPDGGCFIDEIDAKLLGMHKKLADVWQERTYMSKYVLAGLFHGVASCAFFLGAAVGQQILFLPSILEGEKAFSSLNYLKTDVEPTILSKMASLRTSFDKYLAVGVYTAGVVLAFAGGNLIYDGIKMNDNNVAHFGMKFLTMGSGLIFGIGGKYVDMVNTPEPPTKPKKEPLLERIKNGLRSLFPEPVAVPASHPYHDYTPVQLGDDNIYK